MPKQFSSDNYLLRFPDPPADPAVVVAPLGRGQGDRRAQEPGEEQQQRHDVAEREVELLLLERHGGRVSRGGGGGGGGAGVGVARAGEAGVAGAPPVPEAWQDAALAPFAETNET